MTALTQNTKCKWVSATTHKTESFYYKKTKREKTRGGDWGGCAEPGRNKSNSTNQKVWTLERERRIMRKGKAGKRF